ncbi:MAG: hypothetical protein ACRD2P_12425, partial [Terriglobia bacterium]
VGIVEKQGDEPIEMRRWFAQEGDIREDRLIQEEILSFIRDHGALTVVAADRIIGCPHEEGVDSPEGQPYCPQCTFWIGTDRWSGEKLQ